MLDNAGLETTPQPDGSAPQGLMPIRAVTVVPCTASGSETKQQLTINEVLHTFAERKHRIRVFKEAQILFDPKQLPGVTREEGLEFLIKGLQISDLEAQEFRQALGPHSEAGQNVRENFPQFIEYLAEQANQRTVAEIWEATNVDAFTKIALQWEIQDPTKQYADSGYIEKHAGPVAADLRKLDALLKKLSGTEIFLQYTNFGDNISFTALTTADKKGMNFIQQSPKDPNNPYRDVVLGGQAASSEDYACDHIKTAPYLIIPFKLREVLRSKSPELWGGDKYNFWRDGKYRLPFDINNPFPGIITGEELIQQRKDDTGLDRPYNLFKEAAQQSSNHTSITTS